MTAWPFIAAVALFLWFGAAAAQQDDTLPYRLAGTLAAGDAAMAMIQMPDGGYKKVRLGDPFEEGVVAEITAERVIVEFGDDKRWVLKLSGGQVEFLATDDRTVQAGSTLTRFTDFGALMNKIDKARDKHGGEQQIELGAALLAALGLPKQARVVSVGDTPVRSAADLAEALVAALSQGHGVLVSVAGVKGIEQVYLSGAAPPTPVN